MKQLSIITATYNSGDTISKALNSLYSQSLSNFQHIIIDGCSNDETMAIISNFPKENRILVSEKDRGIYDALNKGIMMSNGNIIGLLHSDDQLFDQDTLRKILDIFEDKDVFGVYGNVAYVDKKTRQIVRFWKSCDYNDTLLGQGWMPPHPTLFVRRSVFDEIGMFDTNLSISGDYEFCVRFFQKYGYKTRYVDKVFVYMGNGGVSNRGVVNFIIKTFQDFKVTRLISKNIISRMNIFLKKKLYKITQLILKSA